MREIKFRAWDLEQKKYLNLEWDDYYIDMSTGEVYEIEERTEGYQTYMHKKYLKVELQQYTGMKDSNGAEIYEGDVVRDRCGDIGVIEFHKSWASFFFSLKLRNDDGELKPILSARPMWNEWGSLEVVGNTFEHPHLIDRPKGIESTE